MGVGNRVLVCDCNFFPNHRLEVDAPFTSPPICDSERVTKSLLKVWNTFPAHLRVFLHCKITLLQLQTMWFFDSQALHSKRALYNRPAILNVRSWPSETFFVRFTSDASLMTTPANSPLAFGCHYVLFWAFGISRTILEYTGVHSLWGKTTSAPCVQHTPCGDWQHWLPAVASLRYGYSVLNICSLIVA